MKPADLPQSSLTREAFDRVCIVASRERFDVTCRRHPSVTPDVSYCAGHLHLVCRSCGFDVAKVKVALSELTPTAALPPETHARLEAAARLIETELLGDQADGHARFLRETAQLLHPQEQQSKGKRQ